MDHDPPETTRHHGTKGLSFINSPPVPPPPKVGSPLRSEVTRPRGRGARSAAAAAPGPPGPSAPSCAYRRWDSPGCGPGGRQGQRQGRGRSQDFGPCVLPTRHPPTRGCLLSKLRGGADNRGCSLRRWATSRISPGTWHLAWEPAPPTRSLGKARPALGEGAGTLHVPLCDGVCGHFLGRYWVPGPARSAAPHAHPSEARTPRVGETLTARGGCGREGAGT